MKRCRHAASSILMGGVLMLGCDTAPAPEPEGGPAAMDAGTDAGAEAECFFGDSSSTLGGPCSCQLDCEPGSVCSPESEHGAPSGQCNRICTPGTDECGTGNVCTAVGSGGLCARACTAHTECRDGWACWYGYCQFHCTSDAQCVTGACDPYTATCRPPSDATGGVQALCVRDEECRSGVCMTDYGGHCLTFCQPEANNCPEGATCIGGIDASEPALGICMTPCTSSADCPDMLDCVNAGGGRGSVCWRAG